MRFAAYICWVLIVLLAQTSQAQNIFPDAGNVGIGTLSPRGALHIQRPGAPLGGLPWAENGLLLGTTGTGGYKWIQSYGGILSLNPTGNSVAIGQTSATHVLDVNGAARIRANNLTNLLISSQGDDVFLDLTKNTTVLPSARIDLDGFASQSIHEGELAFFTKQATNSSLVEQMRIHADGTIRIGSSNAIIVTPNGTFRFQGLLEYPLASYKHACLQSVGNLTWQIVECRSAAEYVPAMDGGLGYPNAGDLVSLVPDHENPDGDRWVPFVVRKSGEGCDNRLIGFIADPRRMADGTKHNDHYYPMAVSGFFPVNVTNKSGPIRRGDAITSSSTPGRGMKAIGACRIIGYALEDSDGESTIQVYAHLGDYPGIEARELGLRVRDLEARLAELDRRIGQLTTRPTQGALATGREERVP